MCIRDSVGIDANNAETGSQILFVDGQIGCIWDTGTNTFTYDIRGRLSGSTGFAPVDPDFPFAPIDVCFIDGFLLVANAGDVGLQIPNNTFQLSGFNDAYSWGGLIIQITSALAATDVITYATANQFPTGMPIFFDNTG